MKKTLIVRIGEGLGNQLFMYANNDFKPECCKTSTVSGSTGCACETQEQIDYIARRGGNKSSGAY